MRPSAECFAWSASTNSCASSMHFGSQSRYAWQLRVSQKNFRLIPSTRFRKISPFSCIANQMRLMTGIRHTNGRLPGIFTTDRQKSLLVGSADVNILGRSNLPATNSASMCIRHVRRQTAAMKLPPMCGLPKCVRLQMGFRSVWNS